jgi:hypothetical protein
VPTAGDFGDICGDAKGDVDVLLPVLILKLDAMLLEAILAGVEENRL